MSPQIENLDRMVRDVPAMPTVAQKVMNMLGDPRATNAMLGETLSSDQSMASKILQMANSPFFGTRQKIATISSGIFVMGHSALRSLIVTVCTKGLFKNPGLMEEKIWEHSLGAAVAARAIAEKTALMDPDEAFILGLLHDIGKTSLLVVYHDAYQELFMKAYNENLSMEELRELEREEFGYDHCEVGSRVLLKWRLPPLCARVARRHHSKNAELIQREEEPKLIALASQANLIAARVGFGTPVPDKRVDVVNNLFTKTMEIDKKTTVEIIENTLKVFREAREQFNLS